MQVDIEIQDELGIVKMKASENQHYSARKLAYMAYLKTPHWENLRQERFKIDSQRCVSCGSGSNIQGHHIKYRDDYATCTVDDIVTLCIGCHDYLHHAMSGAGIRNGSLNFEETIKLLESAPKDPETGKIMGFSGSNRDKNRIRRDEILKSFPNGFPENGFGTVVMTSDMMQLLKSDSGAYTRAAMNALGERIGKESGWASRLIGKTFTKEQVRTAHERRNLIWQEARSIVGAKAKKPKFMGKNKRMTNAFRSDLLRGMRSTFSKLDVTVRRGNLSDIRALLAAMRVESVKADMMLDLKEKEMSQQ